MDEKRAAMKFVSLFAGVGGFDLGLEQAGHTCIGQVEIDKNARKILEIHWPNVPKHDDVTTAIDWGKKIGLVGNTDLVVGGFPCQDVSVAGKRAGLAGKRTGLFYDALAFAKSVQAKTILLENVAGLLSSNHGRDFGTVLSELANAGYCNIEWRVLDSQFFGTAQRRRRLFIIASSDANGFKSVLSDPESGSKIAEQDSEVASSAVQNVSSVDAADFGLEFYTVKEVAGKSFGIDRTDVAPTLTALRTGVNSHHTQLFVTDGEMVRRLIPVECERLQGFPDGWTDGQNERLRYKQMGNAVTVNVIKWIGERL